MGILSIIYFMLLTTGFGYTLLSLLKVNINNSVEKILMSVGIGLGTIPILSIIFDLLYIPLCWDLFLLLALLYPTIQFELFLFTSILYEIMPIYGYTWSNLKLIELPKFKWSHLILFIIFIAHFGMMLQGSFVYEYLANGDPWEHADTAYYIGTQHTFALEKDNVFAYHYAEPYPPGYAVLNGLLYQIDNNMNWLLKFFNALIISLGIIFCYYFMRTIINNDYKALVAAFFVAVIPCYLSHFIFAAALATTLFWVGFYCFNKIKENKTWVFIAAIISTSIYVTQPISAGVFAVFIGVYIVAGLLLKQNQKYEIIGYILGLFLSLLFYAKVLLKFGFSIFAEKLGFKMFEGGSFDSSGGVIYNLWDYMFSPLANKIDQPIGFGVFFFIIFIICFVSFIINIKQLFNNKNRSESQWLITSIVLFILTFLASQSNRFTFKFFPHRVWVYITIATIIITSIGIWYFIDAIKNKPIRYYVLGLLLLGILLTSGIPKYAVQTMPWPPDYNYFTPVADGTSPELEGILWMKDNLEYGSNVMIMCHELDHWSAGVNMGSLSYDKEVRDFKNNIKYKTATEILDFAIKKDYKYIAIGLRCISKNILSINETTTLINNMYLLNTTVVYNNPEGMFIFKI